VHHPADTLPTAINLQQGSIQSEAQCSLYNSSRLTTAHVLSSCPNALCQQKSTFRYNQVLSTFTDIFADTPFSMCIQNLPNFYANNALQATILSDLLSTSYRPDIVIYNTNFHPVPIYHPIGINLSSGFHSSYSGCP